MLSLETLSLEIGRTEWATREGSERGSAAKDFNRLLPASGTQPLYHNACSQATFPDSPEKAVLASIRIFSVLEIITTNIETLSPFSKILGQH